MIHGHLSYTPISTTLTDVTNSDSPELNLFEYGGSPAVRRNRMIASGDIGTMRTELAPRRRARGVGCGR